MSLVKTGLSQDLPNHEFCLFLSRNSHENYPGSLHIEWLCDCSVIVLRRSDFRKPFSIKLLLGELEKKHGMNRKLMTKTLKINYQYPGNPSDIRIFTEKLIKNN